MKATSTRSSFGHGQRAHVILVHPDPAVRELLGSYLGDELRLTLCADLGEVSERCPADSPDLLVVDPTVVNGELTALLPRLDSLRRRAPLVLLADPETVTEDLSPGISVLSKPCTPEAVRRRIRQELLQHAA